MEFPRFPAHLAPKSPRSWRRKSIAPSLAPFRPASGCHPTREIPPRNWSLSCWPGARTNPPVVVRTTLRGPSGSSGGRVAIAQAAPRAGQSVAGRWIHFVCHRLVCIKLSPAPSGGQRQPLAGVDPIDSHAPVECVRRVVVWRTRIDLLLWIGSDRLVEWNRVGPIGAFDCIIELHRSARWPLPHN